jgi:uncharacterized protein
MNYFDLNLLSILFFFALIAGCFDAIAGGGGLLTLPALLLVGVDPITAIGTNKLQASFGSVSATVTFARRGLIAWRSALPVAITAMIASVVGALCVKLISKSILNALVPIMLILIAIYFATAKRMEEKDTKARLSFFAFCAFVAPLVGFYDGIFGPGTGAFYMVGFVSLLGFGVTKATAHTKLANAASNIGSLSLFILNGSVIWMVGLTMAVGALIGAQIGARLAIKMGATLIRPLLVVISCAMAIKLLWDPNNWVRQVFSNATQIFLN